MPYWLYLLAFQLGIVRSAIIAVLGSIQNVHYALEGVVTEGRLHSLQGNKQNHVAQDEQSHCHR